MFKVNYMINNLENLIKKTIDFGKIIPLEEFYYYLRLQNFWQCTKQINDKYNWARV